VTGPLGTPLTCRRCEHTVRDGEAYETQMFAAASGPPVPGVVHVRCPRLVLVPCPPCLDALLRGDEGSHGCHEVTSVGVEGDRLVAGIADDCPCSCPERRVAESAALQAARTEARAVSAPAAPSAG